MYIDLKQIEFLYVFIPGLKKISSSSSLGHYDWHPQNFP